MANIDVTNEVSDYVKNNMIGIRDGLEAKGFVQSKDYGFGRNDEGWWLWMNIGNIGISASLEEPEYQKNYRLSNLSSDTEH